MTKRFDSNIPRTNHPLPTERTPEVLRTHEQCPTCRENGDPMCPDCGGLRLIEKGTARGYEAESVPTSPTERTCSPHDFRFDGDDPYVVCAKCGERQDAITGRAIRPMTTPTERTIQERLLELSQTLWDEDDPDNTGVWLREAASALNAAEREPKFLYHHGENPDCGYCKVIVEHKTAAEARVAEYRGLCVEHEQVARDLLARAQAAETRIAEVPPHLAKRSSDWLASNQKQPSDVRWGMFPLGMVQRWIDRAEAAEARLVLAAALADAIDPTGDGYGANIAIRAALRAFRGQERSK